MSSATKKKRDASACLWWSRWLLLVVTLLSVETRVWAFSDPGQPLLGQNQFQIPAFVGENDVAWWYDASDFTDASRGLVRSSLPELRESVADAFEGPVRQRTFKVGDRVYRSPNVGPGAGGLESAAKPGPWFATRRTVTRVGTESQLNVENGKILFLWM